MTLHGRRRALYVLVVDDDPVVADVTREIMLCCGHLAMSAYTAEDALRRLAGSEDAVDLLWTDLRMPGMSGLELAHRARALMPGLSVVVATGADLSELPPGAEGFLFVQKPFSLEVVERILSACPLLDTGLAVGKPS